jgi:hypothetical protein
VAGWYWDCKRLRGLGLAVRLDGAGPVEVALLSWAGGSARWGLLGLGLLRLLARLLAGRGAGLGHRGNEPHWE